MTSEISPKFAPCAANSPKGKLYGEKEKRRLWANVAAYVGLSVVVAVDDADDLFLLISRNTDALQSLTAGTIRADFCCVISSGKCRSIVVFCTAKRTNSCYLFSCFHCLHPSR